MSRVMRQYGVALLCALAASLLCLPNAEAAPARATTAKQKKAVKRCAAKRTRRAKRRCFARLAARRHDRTKPVVAFKAPTGGTTVSGSLSGTACEASAIDQGGVDRVEFSVDGAALNVARAAPYNCAWDTTGAPSGQHTLTARAVDTSGNTARTSITVSVVASEPAPAPTPAPTATPTPTPAATPTPTPTPTPEPTPPPSGEVTLEQVNGGLAYYGQFTSPLPTLDTYFPIGAWFRPAENQAQVDAYKAFGMNLFVGVECPECTNEAAIRAGGMRTLIYIGERTRFNDLGAEVAGWLIDDEADMQQGPGSDTTNCTGAGYDTMRQANANTPNDGKARYANYGKGLGWWEANAQAQCWLNAGFQNLVSMDAYWFTDPNERGVVIDGQVRYGKASSYGWSVDRMQYLDGLDGRRMPIWNFVETGWPWSESATQGGRRILPREAVAAVWWSIVAGARGILYFDHNFGAGSCSGSTIRGECYADTHDALQAANQQIHALAPQLNSPTVASGVTTSSNIGALVKWDGQHFYVFTAAKAGGTGTVNMPCLGDATATRIGEAGSVPVTGGSFSDAFADQLAVHIYRIDGGSRCGL